MRHPIKNNLFEKGAVIETSKGLKISEPVVTGMFKKKNKLEFK